MSTVDSAFEVHNYFDFNAASDDFSCLSPPALRSLPMDDGNLSILFSPNSESYDASEYLESSNGLVSNMFGRRVEQLDEVCDLHFHSLSSIPSSSSSSTESTPLSVISDQSLPGEDLPDGPSPDNNLLEEVSERFHHSVRLHSPQNSLPSNNLDSLHPRSYPSHPNPRSSSRLSSKISQRVVSQSIDITCPPSNTSVPHSSPYSKSPPLFASPVAESPSPRPVDPLPSAPRRPTRRPGVASLEPHKVATKGMMDKHTSDATVMRRPKRPSATPVKPLIEEDSDDEDPEEVSQRSRLTYPRPVKRRNFHDDDSDEYKARDEPFVHSRRRGCKPPVKRYPCTMLGCKETFTRPNDVRRHLRNAAVHRSVANQDDNNSTRCTFCGEELSRADARRRHELKGACGKRTIRRKDYHQPPE